MSTIAAVIVTNNRLALLQEAIAALRAQTYPINHTIIIDNDSEDGTAVWLKTQEDLIIKQQDNCGGSGGMHSGIRMAIGLNADWIWVMDDDTICSDTALERLMDKMKFSYEGFIGYIGSKCLWKDNSPHLMNVPLIKPNFNEKIPFNKYDNVNLLLTENNSFVSVLINANAVKAVGLPYKEFFIWGDDQEYTRRITKAGYLGFYCLDSFVLHKTSTNYFPDFYGDSVINLWKHKYGLRNEFFMVKKRRGFIYFIFWLIAKMAYTSFKIIKIRKMNRFTFISALCNSAWKSIFFNPHIDFV